jgi:hypothetical protein
MDSKVMRTFLVVGALALMMFGASAVPVSANGGTGGFHCNAVIGAVCIGQINGNSVEVDLGNVTVLSGNKVDIENFLNNDAVNVANLDVQTQINKLAVDVAGFLNHNLGFQVCQIKVIEIGLVNTNIAKCS